VRQIRIRDSCFSHTVAMCAAGENADVAPEHFIWCRGICDSVTTFYTDAHLLDAVQDFHPRRVALLIEPPSHSNTHYELAIRHRRSFHAILTHDARLLSFGDTRFKFYPFGGSWIDRAKWGVYPKTKSVCMIASKKKTAPGHKIRHEIARRFDVDLYGTDYNPIDSKADVLRDYRYAVVVEPIRMDYFFSEKLVDALSMGAVPIYYGAPSVGEFFDGRGIIPFKTIAELEGILESIGPMDYASRLEAVKANVERCAEYAVPEDWMFEHYPELFK